MAELVILCDGSEHVVDASPPPHTVTPDAFERVTGWRVEERGLCRGDVCIPASTAGVVSDGRVDLAAAAGAMRREWVTEPAAAVGVLGEAAADRAAALASLEAPEFALPDLDGNIHRLSDFRGRKVLLAAFASW